MRRLLLIAMVSFFVISLTPAHAKRKSLEMPLGEISKEQVIDKYFKDRTLDDLEGIWTTEDSVYEFAILQNSFGVYAGYDYIGLLTQTRNSGFKKGETKMLVKKTASKLIYPGIWFMGDKSEDATSYHIMDANTIQYTTPTGAYGAQESMTLLRTYPAGGGIPSAGKAEPGAQYSGTGFFVGTDTILTNYHVVAEASDIQITLHNGTKLSGKVIVKDPSNDLALVKVSAFTEKIDPIPISKPQAVKVGAKVYTIGFPLPDELGTAAKLGEGIVNSVTGIDDDPRTFQVSIPIQPGNSGGPLLDSTGQAIGVVTSTLNNVYLFVRKATISQNVNFAVKINYVDNLVALVPGGIGTTAQDPSLELDASKIMESRRTAVVFVLVSR